jgi:hypothetical protein
MTPEEKEQEGSRRAKKNQPVQEVEVPTAVQILSSLERTRGFPGEFI